MLTPEPIYKINAGLVNEGDTIIYVTDELKIDCVFAVTSHIFDLPENTILCWVNYEIKVNLTNLKPKLDIIDEIIEARKKQFSELKK